MNRITASDAIPDQNDWVAVSRHSRIYLAQLFGFVGVEANACRHDKKKPKIISILIYSPGLNLSVCLRSLPPTLGSGSAPLNVYARESCRNTLLRRSPVRLQVSLYFFLPFSAAKDVSQSFVR